MKSFRDLLPHLALFLAQVAGSQPGPSLLDACEKLSIGHNDGVLSGKCRGAGEPMLTSLDLDQCLGWGPRAAVRLGLRGSTTVGLAPKKEYVIEPGRTTAKLTVDAHLAVHSPNIAVLATLSTRPSTAKNLPTSSVTAALMARISQPSIHSTWVRREPSSTSFVTRGNWTWTDHS